MRRHAHVRREAERGTVLWGSIGKAVINQSVVRRTAVILDRDLSTLVSTVFAYEHTTDDWTDSVPHWYYHHWYYHHWVLPSHWYYHLTGAD
jgi:hypothetical protein